MRERDRVGPLGKLVRYTAVVLLLAGAVAVYWNFDTLRGISVDFSGFVDLVARRAKDTVAAVSGGAAQTEVVKETEVVGTAAPSSLSGSPPVVPEPTTAKATPAPESLPATTSPTASAPTHAPPAPAAAPEPPPGPEQFSFGLAKIEVSEGAASADVLVLRGGDMRRPSSVRWWTTDGTAKAGQDYVDLGRVVLKFAASEQNRAIHVPIIGDKAAEGPESFYVNLAWGEDEGPVERVEVVIVDDD